MNKVIIFAIRSASDSNITKQVRVTFFRIINLIYSVPYGTIESNFFLTNQEELEVNFIFLYFSCCA